MDLNTSNMSVYVSFLLALLLVSLPVPWSLAGYMPHWVFITAVFWGVYFPHRFGVIRAWIFGLLLDVLMGFPMGVNAFAICISTALVLVIAPRFKIYGLGLQIWMVFIMVAVCQLLTYWAKNIFSAPESGLATLWPAFTSALVWPVLYGYLRYMTRLFHTL